MSTQRLEAFSDGVIAVIITITVLDLKQPVDSTWTALAARLPLLLVYVLSFTVVGIMWVNHHHMMHLARHASAKVMWSNNLLLFWMSLIPFVTTYLGNNHGKPLAVAAYGSVLTMCALSFTLLRYVVNQFHLHEEAIARHNHRILRKSMGTMVLYAASVPLAYVSIQCSFGIFALIPVMFFLPERKLAECAPDSAA